MKTAIIYYSEHHNNTKKILDAIAKENEVTLIDASDNAKIDLSTYDLIGFASGIYYSKFHESVLQFAEKNLPKKKKVFFLYTCGIKRKNYLDAIKEIVDSKNAQVLGAYGCLGFDTYGPFKLIGGVSKGRPNEADISEAVKFFKEMEGFIENADDK